MKNKHLIILVIILLPLFVKAQSYSGTLTHTSGYFSIKPFGTSYDDGSYVKSFYDGNKKRLVFWNSVTTYTNLLAGSFFAMEKVGIGTSVPQTLLDLEINGTGNQHGKGVYLRRGTGYLKLQNGTGSDYFAASITGKGTTNWASSGVYLKGIPANDESGYIGISLIAGESAPLVNSDVLKIKNYSTDLVTVTASGNVGIGTSTPTSKLTVEDNSSDLSILKLTNKAWVSNQRMSIEFWNGGSKNYPTSRIVSQMDGSGTQGEALIFETQTAGATSPSTKMVIKNNGNVGIGKLTPTAKLHVDGTIISEEVRVEVVNPPDYVFDKKYNLPTLAEIEAFVKQNHHLPEVPSAAEMEVNGVELGKMNMLLLLKIEELTLHVIELNRKNEVLVLEVSELKQDIENKNP